MPSYWPPKKNTGYITYIGLLAVGSSNIFQSNPTIAAGDFKVSIDGGTLANLATLPVVTPTSSKLVKVTLSAAEMNGDNILLVASDAVGAEWKDVILTIPTSVNNLDDLATLLAALNNVSVAQILAGTIEGSYDLQETLKLILSVSAGKSSGGGTTTVTFRDTADAINRIVATVDENGNRSAVTLNAS